MATPVRLAKRATSQPGGVKCYYQIHYWRRLLQLTRNVWPEDGHGCALEHHHYVLSLTLDRLRLASSDPKVGLPSAPPPRRHSDPQPIFFRSVYDAVRRSPGLLATRPLEYLWDRWCVSYDSNVLQCVADKHQGNIDTRCRPWYTNRLR